MYIRNKKRVQTLTFSEPRWIKAVNNSCVLADIGPNEKETRPNVATNEGKVERKASWVCERIAHASCAHWLRIAVAPSA
eukprot:3399804-Amphidinium_carterae.1